MKNVVNNSTANLALRRACLRAMRVLARPRAQLRVRDYFNCKKKDEMDVSLKISLSHMCISRKVNTLQGFLKVGQKKVGTLVFDIL